MIWTIIVRIVIVTMLVVRYFDAKDEAAKRSKLTPEQRRPQKVYARQRKRRWQLTAKYPGGAWAGRPGKTPQYDPATAAAKCMLKSSAQQELDF